MPPLSPRANLSHDLAGLVRDRILAGEVAADERINEVWLSRELGVSRTPLREGLAALVAEGFLRSEPRRGLFVTPLSADELRHLYPIRALLDPHALELAGVPTQEQRDELERTNREIERSSGTPARTIDLDEAWHRKVVEHCPNPVLLELIDQMMLRTRRYEYAYLREHEHVSVAVHEHRQVLAALGEGDLQAACAALRRNLESGAAPILQWLARREHG